MELPESFIQHLIDASSEPAGRDKTEARRSRRKLISACVPFAIIRDGKLPEPTAVLTRNVSRSGLSIMRSTAMSIGEHFVVWLPTKDRQIAIHGLITWVEAIGRNSFIAGGRFTHFGEETLGKDRKALFVDKLAAAVLASDVIEPNLTHRTRMTVPD